MAIEARVAALEAEREIRDLLTLRSHAVDYGNAPAFVNCYTDDVEYETRFMDGVEARSPNRGGSAEGNSYQYRGKQAIEELIARHTHAPEVYHKHLVMDIAIDVSVESGTGSAQSYVMRLDRDQRGIPYVQSFGRYLDTLRRCDDGRWRISKRVTEVEALDIR
jgi:ketosteroid isomerase-like protein